MWAYQCAQHPGFEADVCLEVQSLIPPQRGGKLASWWDAEFLSRVPEFPQGLLFKGKLVCSQLDPWATFDSCSKNNKTDGQNRFWGSPSKPPSSVEFKEGVGLAGELLLLHYVLPLASENRNFLPKEDERCRHVVFSWWELSLAVRK